MTLPIRASAFAAFVSFVSFVALGTSGGATDGPAETPRSAEQTRAIEGVVVDEAGAPVPSAQVEWRPVGRDPVKETCDGEGRFRFVVPDGERFYRLQAADPDGRRMAAVGLAEIGGGMSRPLDGSVTMTLAPTHEIVARVAGPDGNPVEAAMANAWGYCDAGDHQAFWSVIAETDAAGEAKLRVPLKATVSELIALKPGVGMAYHDREEQASRVEAAEVPLRLAAARTVRVRTIDEEGRPVPDGYVYPSTFKRKGAWRAVNTSGGRITTGFTDAAGIAVFDWLPAELEGSVAFSTAGRDYHQPDFASFTPGQAEDVTLQVYRRVPVSGRVVDPEGHPAAGVVVRADGRGIATHDDRGSVRTAADGSYRLLLAPEAAYLVGIDDGERVSEHRTVVVRKGKPVEGTDLVLVAPTIVRGRVTAGDEERPVEGAFLSLRLEGGAFPDELQALAKDNVIRQLAFHRSAETDAEGEFEFKVAPGDYLLFARTANRPVDSGSAPPGKSYRTSTSPSRSSSNSRASYSIRTASRSPGPPSVGDTSGAKAVSSGRPGPTPKAGSGSGDSRTRCCCSRDPKSADSRPSRGSTRSRPKFGSTSRPRPRRSCR